MSDRPRISPRFFNFDRPYASSRRGVGGLVAATVALVAMMAIFVFAVFALYCRSVDYVRRDLEARAELAANVLEEPLRTQDFRRIREFSAECEARGLLLKITHRDGGELFHTVGDVPGFSAWHGCGEYRVGLGVNGIMMLLPFLGALALAGLAFLVGIAGMLFVFFAFYRQRAKLAEMSRLQAERYKFVTKFTHELKTPLTGIIAAADMMEGDRLADMIKSSAHRLDQLAQELVYMYWGRGDADRRSAGRER